MSSEIASELIQRVVAGLRALGTETDRLDAAAATRFGLNRTDARALDMISQVSGMTAKELARFLGMTTGGVTTVIDRLEDGGYVRRRPHPTDRRQVIVEPTHLTAERAVAIYGPLIRQTEQLAQAYSARQLSMIAEFLALVSRATNRHADTLIHEEPPTGTALGRRTRRRHQGLAP